MVEEVFDVCSNRPWKKNFVCILTNTGLWRIESERYNRPVFGKWILLIKPVNGNNSPTFADQRNFIFGLLEAERRNDQFVMSDGLVRPPQHKSTILKFSKILSELDNRADIKDTPHDLNYYLKMSLRVG